MERTKVKKNSIFSKNKVYYILSINLLLIADTLISDCWSVNIIIIPCQSTISYNIACLMARTKKTTWVHWLLRHVEHCALISRTTSFLSSLALSVNSPEMGLWAHYTISPCLIHNPRRLPNKSRWHLNLTYPSSFKWKQIKLSPLPPWHCVWVVYGGYHVMGCVHLFPLIHILCLVLSFR